MSTPTLPARSAEVSITPGSVQVTRSSVSSSLFPDAKLSLSQLIGWNLQAPDGLSPGWIELLSRDEQEELVRTRVNFSPMHLEDFLAVHQRLTNLQAGYDLDDVREPAVSSAAENQGKKTDSAGNSSANSAQAAVSPDEWLSGAGNVGVVSGDKEEKSGKTPAPWAKVATPDEVPEANEDADIDNPIYGQNVTVTGDVEPYDKGDVWNMIADAGGTVGKNVTKKTTMLVVGEWASVTTKEKRARELQEKGQEIKIITFSEFLEAVGKEATGKD
ncbi:BRCT domain-containing protein [uncultured Corynebacterium sp.]|uniref:BRCT domain-containing protein n=1 Tax=uncultured Corynebacterium sp. TaxID=159447 RepID=UPI002594D421|nr:BRCT domain-containing protein [uncultured Corynebacterium sp.]